MDRIFGPEISILTFVSDGQNFNRGGKNMRKRYENAGDEVDQRSKNYMLIHGTDYPTAMRAILNADEVLKEQYTGISPETEIYSTEYPAGKYTQVEISAEVDRRVQVLLRENRGLSYPEAMIEVLNSDLELKQAYHGSYYKEVK